MAYIALNDPEEFKDFWEQMAADIKLLNHTNEEPHYYPADIYDLGDAFRIKLQSPALVSMCISSGILDGSSHIQERVTSLVWILAKEERADEESKLEVLSNTKEIVYQVLARLQKYRSDLELPGFEIKNVRIAQVSNVNPGWHGYSLNIPILVPVKGKMSYNEDNYN
jgi:HSP20 family molecular chaperone IbpA